MELSSTSPFLRDIATTRGIVDQVLSLAGGGKTDLSLGLFVNDHDVFHNIVDGCDLRLTIFRWKRAESGTLRGELRPTLSGIWISNKRRQLACYEAIPDSDSDDSQTGAVKVIVSEPASLPDVLARTRTSTDEIVRALHLRNAHELKTTVSYRTDHARVITTGVIAAASVITVASTLLSLCEGETACCCEDSGNAFQISALHKTNEWNVGNIPSDVRPTSFYRGDYAVAPRAALRAIPNVSKHIAYLLMERAWLHADAIPLMVVGREFLSWQIGQLTTPMLQGNSFRLWIDDGVPKIVLGIDSIEGAHRLQRALVDKFQEMGALYGITFAES